MKLLRKQKVYIKLIDFNFFLVSITIVLNCEKQYFKKLSLSEKVVTKFFSLQIF